MYNFIDTNTHSSVTTLPAEAVSINGTYLENIIDGYRTLYVKGRESLANDLNTYSVGTADGERVKGSRYHARILTVGFQLLCQTNAEFRQQFNQLNNILSIGEADFVFNDEQDKYFTGYPIMDAEIEAGRNNVVGEWQIYCAYPFKRSVNLLKISSTDQTGVVIGNNSATFTFNYNGTAPSKPLLRATFTSGKTGGDYNEDGDCGFVAFLNQDESIVQLGNPNAIDLDTLNKNDTLINSEFSTLEGWTNNGMSVVTISDNNWGEGVGQTNRYASGVGTLSRTTTGCTNFEFDIVHRLYDLTTSGNHLGTFKASLKNGNDVVVGFEIEKASSGKVATVKYILDNTVVGTDIVDVSEFNENFGLCNKYPLYVTEDTYTYARKRTPSGNVLIAKTRPAVTDGFVYTQSNLNSGISRNGGTVTFSIGELADRTFKKASIASTPIYDVVFEITGNFTVNAIGTCSLIQKKGVPFSDTPNVFTAGDVVEADCSSANVVLYRNGSLIGHLEPQYGALGNDWEAFGIRTGQNVIKAVWSDWVNTNYKPKIEIVYNEVYI